MGQAAACAGKAVEGGEPAAVTSSPAKQPQPEFSKGETVLYHQRDGSWAEAKVVAIDYSVLPFSYGIEIDGHYRETEAPRLAHLSQKDELMAQQQQQGVHHNHHAHPEHQHQQPGPGAGEAKKQHPHHKRGTRRKSTDGA